MAEQMAIATIHVSDFNAPDNTITVAMIGGTGAYEYTLHYTDNNGIPQTITQNSPIFEHLDANTYQIEVSDLNNCSVSIFSNDVYVLDYPPFFTPNGDGVNETWTITGANIIPNSKIYIFDRYGKVLTQVDPTSVLGWDGTYKGVLVSDSDYWFTAEYIDPNTGESKVVKGHFSLVVE
jgi:gliding motility-associated-like protein